MKLIPYPHINQLCESMQVNEVKFAFTNKQENGDYQLITNFVKCREYFNEFLMVNHHPDQFKFEEVHGFKYKHEEYPYQMQNPSIAIKLPRKDLYETFKTNLEWLNSIEDFNGMEKTYIVETSDARQRGATFVLEFSSMWINSCILFNIYTLLIKLCTLDIKNKTIKTLLETFNYIKPSELTYVECIKVNKLNSILNNLKSFMKFPDMFVDGFKAIRNAYAVHGQSGLLHLNNYPNEFKDSPLIETFNSIVNKKPEVEFIA